MPQPDREEVFIRLLAQHERMLAAYVMTLVPRSQDADDILQEAKVIMWRNFDRFQLGTNFGAWARKIAFHQVLSYRKRRKRDNCVEFSEEFYRVLADELESASDHLEERQRALNRCLDRLPEEQRHVLDLRYQEELPINTVADRMNRTVAAAYRLLSRARLTLRDCVNRMLNSSIPYEHSPESN